MVERANNAKFAKAVRRAYTFDPLDYSIIKVVAASPWDARGYRVSFTACSDFSYESPTGAPKRWSDADLADTVARHAQGGLRAKAIRCNRAMWEAAKAGKLAGFAPTSDVDATVTPAEW